MAEKAYSRLSSSSSEESSSSESSINTGIGTKRPHQEYDNESMVDVVPVKKKKQHPISGFLNALSTTESVTSTVSVVQSSQAFDAVIEVYRFGTTKHCWKRNTIVSFDCINGDLSKVRKALRKQYGLGDDACRAHIASFTIDLGITPRSDSRLQELPTFIAKSEEEWRNVTARLQSQLQHYQLLGEYGNLIDCSCLKHVQII